MEVPVLGCMMHTFHLKAVRTSGFPQGYKTLPIYKGRCTSSFTNTDPGRVGTTEKVATEHQIRKCWWLHPVQGAVQRRLKLMKESGRVPGQ